MRIVIIGGSTAGTLCALELRKKNKDVEITILEKGSDLQFSPCAMPYVLSGEIEDVDKIRLMSEDDYDVAGIRMLTGKEVRSIDPDKKKVLLSDDEEIYDKLVIATGSVPKKLPIDIEDGSDINFFKTLKDLSDVTGIRSKDVLVVGAGLIGVEVAYALMEKGKDVTLVEATEHILPNVMDPDMAKEVEDYILRSGVDVRKSASVSKIAKDYSIVDEEKISSGSTIIAVGFSPVLDLAKESGIEIDQGIKTDKHMRTNNKNIFACGDCVESRHMITGDVFLSQLATTANEQAKVVARNLLGEEVEVRPILNSSISKVGNLYFGSLGLTSGKAKNKTIDNVSARYSSFNTAEYYAKDSRFIVKLIADMDGRLIGAQIVSDQNISGHLNMLSLAMGRGMKIHDVMHMETCYNPAANPLHDPMKVCAEILDKKLGLKRRRKR